MDDIDDSRRLNKLHSFDKAKDHYEYDEKKACVISYASGEARPLAWCNDSDGYRVLNVQGQDGKPIRVRRSHVQLEANGFPRPGPEYEADHRNDNNADDALANLMWVKREDNKPRSGKRNALQGYQASFVQTEHDTENPMLSTAELARYMRVTKRTVNNAAARRTHANVAPLPPPGPYGYVIDLPTGEMDDSEPKPPLTEEDRARIRAKARRNREADDPTNP